MHRSKHGPGGACVPIWPIAKRPARTRQAAPPRHPEREGAAATTAETAGPTPKRSYMARDAARGAAAGPGPGARRIGACARRTWRP